MTGPKLREFWIHENIIQKFGMDTLVPEDKKGFVEAVDRNSYDQLLEEKEDLLKRYCKLKAREINNSPLRTYDGLADKADKYDQLLEEAKRLAEALGKSKGAMIYAYDDHADEFYNNHLQNIRESITRWQEHLKGESDADT